MPRLALGSYNKTKATTEQSLPKHSHDLQVVQVAEVVKVVEVECKMSEVKAPEMEASAVRASEVEEVLHRPTKTTPALLLCCTRNTRHVPHQ